MEYYLPDVRKQSCKEVEDDVHIYQFKSSWQG